MFCSLSRPARGASLACAITLLAGCAGRTTGDLPENVGGDAQPDNVDGPQSNVDAPAPSAPSDSGDVQYRPEDAPVEQQRTLELPNPFVLAAESCGARAQGQRLIVTAEQFESMLVGSWLLCDFPSVFGTTDEVGLIIHPDFTWQKLFVDEGGWLYPSSNWEEAGTWETVDTSLMNGQGAYQLNMKIDGSGTVITHPAFAVQPVIMRMDNHGVFAADYAKM
jgi:hypothetical protein